MMQKGVTSRARMWVPLALLWPLSCTVTAQAVERRVGGTGTEQHRRAFQAERAAAA